jgi:LCP family protein required for cell wall assembly
MLVVVLVAVAVAFVFARPPNAPEPPAIELHRVAEAKYFEPAKKPLLFALIIGSDVREGDPRRGRSDSLHILAVNTKTGKGTLVGIPRDSWVPIPGHGTAKINDSLAFGGPELTVATVEELTGIPIEYWALVDFSRFRELVDALGGVEVDVPYAMRDHDSGAYFDPGRIKMNGREALAFARNRHGAINGDFGRSANQGRLLIAALAKFHKTASDPLRIAKYLVAFKEFVSSNVGVGELIELARAGAKLDPGKIRNVVVPGHTGSAGGASVVFLAPADLFKTVREHGAP